jgi:hypothetical protein
MSAPIVMTTRYTTRRPLYGPTVHFARRRNERDPRDDANRSNVQEQGVPLWRALLPERTFRTKGSRRLRRQFGEARLRMVFTALTMSAGS